MTPTLIYLTESDVDTRRSELLSRAGRSLDELRAQYARYELTPEEQSLLRKLEDVEFFEGREAF